MLNFLQEKYSVKKFFEEVNQQGLIGFLTGYVLSGLKEIQIGIHITEESFQQAIDWLSEKILGDKIISLDKKIEQLNQKNESVNQTLKNEIQDLADASLSNLGKVEELQHENEKLKKELAENNKRSAEALQKLQQNFKQKIKALNEAISNLSQQKSEDSGEETKIRPVIDKINHNLSDLARQIENLDLQLQAMKKEFFPKSQAYSEKETEKSNQTTITTDSDPDSEQSKKNEHKKLKEKNKEIRGDLKKTWRKAYPDQDLPWISPSIYNPLIIKLRKQEVTLDEAVELVVFCSNLKDINKYSLERIIKLKKEMEQKQTRTNQPKMVKVQPKAPKKNQATKLDVKEVNKKPSNDKSSENKQATKPDSKLGHSATVGERLLAKNGGNLPKPTEVAETKPVPTVKKLETPDELMIAFSQSTGGTLLLNGLESYPAFTETINEINKQNMTTSEAVELFKKFFEFSHDPNPKKIIQNLKNFKEFESLVEKLQRETAPNNNDQPSINTKDLCAFCDQPIDRKKRPKSAFCSDACSDKAYRLKKKQATKQEKELETKKQAAEQSTGKEIKTEVTVVASKKKRKRNKKKKK